MIFLQKMLTVLDSILNITEHMLGEQRQYVDVMAYMFKVLEHIEDGPTKLPSDTNSGNTLHNIGNKVLHCYNLKLRKFIMYYEIIT